MCPRQLIETPFDLELSEIDAFDSTVSQASSLKDFIYLFSRNKLTPTPHLDPLISAIEGTQSKEHRLCVHLPPRHGKTTTIMYGLAYLLRRDPTKTHAYVTYADRLTRSKSRAIRRIALNSGVRLEAGSKSVQEWRTEEGGGLIATSIGGALTGQGITGLLIVDDPFKGREDAESGAMREKVWEWFGDVAYTRLEPGSSAIVVQTRWHPEDLIGRLLDPDRAKLGEEEDRWNHINLPAISPAGGALWPSQYPVKKLDKIRSQIGDFSFASLYQGEPRPRGANIFHEPARYQLTANSHIRGWLEGKYLVIGIDPAASKKTSSDYSVIVVMAKENYNVDSKAWIVDVRRVQCTVPDFVDVIRGVQEKYRCPMAVESVGGFKAIPQMLRKIDPDLRIIEIHPTRDKVTRSQPLAAAWNDGRVLVPTNRRWSDAFIAEFDSFTGLGDRHDDQVDATAHAWNTLTRHRTITRGSRVAGGPFG